MPLPPSGLPSGVSTSQLNAHPFYPNYHTAFYQKEMDREVIFPIKYVSKHITTGSTAFTIASLTLDTSVDYLMIQATAPITLSNAAGSLGGLNIPTNTIFNLPMNLSDLNRFTVSVSGSTTVTIFAFKIDY